MPPIRVYIDCPAFEAVRASLERLELESTDALEDAQIAVVAPGRLDAITAALADREPSGWPVLLAFDERRVEGGAAKHIASGVDDYASLDDGDARILERLMFVADRARRRAVHVEHALRGREARERQALLTGVTDAIVAMLGSDHVFDSIDGAFERLGQAAGVDRVYLAMHGRDAAGAQTIGVSHAWHGEAVPPLPPGGLFVTRQIAEESRPLIDRLDRGEAVSFVIDELPDAVRERLTDATARSILAVPVLHGGRTMGHVGFVDCHAPRRWKPESSAILATMAVAIGEVFVRDDATRELSRQAARLRALYEATDPTLDVRAQLDATLRMATRAFGMASAVITKIDPSSPERGEIVEGVHEDERLRAGTAVPITAELRAAMDEGAPMVVDDVPEGTLGRREYGVRAAMVVPIHVGDETWGALCLLAHEPRSEPTSEAERSALSLLGRFVTLLLTRRVDDERREALEQRMRDSQRLESLGVLAGGVAHDFNNLLMAILGNAELTLLDLPEPSDARENVRQITLAAQRAAELTQQMLAYAGKARIQAQALRLDRLVAEMSELLGVVLPPNATLEVGAGAEVPSIEADSAQIRQIVMNLVTNAGDALDGAPGTIGVRVEEVVLDEAPVGIGQRCGPGRYVALEVSDTGRGMSEPLLSRVFDPFFTTKENGRGLGLAVVGGLVRAHGGLLQVDSAPGEGTTFRVLFEAAVQTEAPARESEDPPPAALEGARLLVVDDAPMVRQTVRRLLEQRGATVAVAADGASALGRLDANERFDGVVLDLTMPGKSGFEVLSELRASFPELPVVLMSGYAEEALAARDLKGATFLQKPFQPRELVRAVARLLSERSTTR